MRQFRMHTSSRQRITNVVVLVRLSNLYSKEHVSIDLFVDPWHLFDASLLSFGATWMMTGRLHKDSTDREVKKPNAISSFLSGGLPTTSQTDQKSLVKSLHARGPTSPFEYKPLLNGDIRLLYLLPGKKEDQLQAIVIHVPQGSTMAYRALSYVWGADERIQKLETPDGFIQITLSLEKTLRSLRHTSEATMLWVDTVSINQDDTKEKASQIRYLPQIFQSSTSTYAFLDGGEESEAAMTMLMQVRAKAVLDARSKGGKGTGYGKRSHPGYNTNQDEDDDNKATPSKNVSGEDEWPAALPRIPAFWNGKSIPPLDHAVWADVKTTFDLPWFRRVWIIQEVIAAPSVKIVCGTWIVDWNDLFLAMETVDREVQITGQDFSLLKSSWEPFLSLATQREWEARQCRWNLLLLLEQFRYCKSTLSRDRLFALLGLALDGNETEFEPEYDSSLEQILLNFARVFVRQGRGIQLLYRAGLNSQSHRFPSWIPDWTMNRPVGLYDSTDTGVTFSASGPQEASIECIPNTDELNVSGYDVDVIEKISTASNVERDWDKYFIEVDEMIDSAVLTSVGCSQNDLKWKVPVAGALFPRAAGSGAIDMKKSYVAFRKYIRYTRRKDRDHGSSNASGDLHHDRSSYIAVLQDTLRGWRFVVTKRGYVGIVPDMAQIGDIVAILKGGAVPFVLKKSEARPGAVRLVGECYIHGIMNGQSLWLPGVVESTFRLH